MVGVIGCGGETVNWGWPSESFVIDGKTYAIHHDPTADPKAMFFNVQLFASPTLTPGIHTLVVTNLNGTVPNRLWIDHFWYIPSDATSSTVTQSSTSPGTSLSSTKSTPPSSSLASASSTRSSVTPNPATASQLPPSVASSIVPTTSPAPTTQSPASTIASSTLVTSDTFASNTPSLAFTTSLLASISISTSTSVAPESASSGSVASDRPPNLVAIIGGAVGGAVAVLLLAMLAIYCLIKHKLTRAQRVPQVDGYEGSSTSSLSTGHRPRLPTWDAPNRTLSAVSLLDREQDASALRSSIVPAPPSAPVYQRQSRPPPIPLPARESTLQRSGASSLASNPQSVLVSALEHQHTATSNQTLLSHEAGGFEHLGPPPYAR
ncbi:hypothetical protein VTO73DRAFT_3566 [Trametes versicolor]